MKVEFNNGTAYLGDCLEIMPTLEEKFDLVLTDPPYGTTACIWDSVIPFEPMWNCIKKLRNEKTPVALFGSEPFSSYLRMSNIKEFKYDWIWNKKLAGNGILAKVQPLKVHEICSLFCNHRYLPIMTKGIFRNKGLSNPDRSKMNYGNIKPKRVENDEYYPKSIIEFTLANLRKERIHPTQKPVSLIAYLIKTYTNEKELVLDFTAGSGTTAIACIKTNRQFVVIEKEPEYFDILCNRIKEEEAQLKLF